MWSRKQEPNIKMTELTNYHVSNTTHKRASHSHTDSKAEMYFRTSNTSPRLINESSKTHCRKMTCSTLHNCTEQPDCSGSTRLFSSQSYTLWCMESPRIPIRIVVKWQQVFSSTTVTSYLIFTHYNKCDKTNLPKIFIVKHERIKQGHLNLEMYFLLFLITLGT